ncbi:two-component response regulator [Actinomyces sp. Chiba101]|uniref:DNA-binding response regulator, NarL/FixJ family, contains REC and HTH domains n=1 Tax=Actinomyces denticolens TaxID=52767 RepID=A0ABY1IG75_9ACTO|nr:MULTISPECIES: response regulator transcription factor [Actinomyces]BAW92719.1 two-component response regulator [Actinomyces sp. Chiba101]GAV94316.1 two-component system response regulator [Actinomyces denticolens]SHJ12851.1 DNA-binding response regulator, NarL/FixJ family, contains REC and HTH domains [Actinomyces denticolens]SUU07434.1 Nitrogen regulation protein C [Actinomyces denticolens]
MIRVGLADDERLITAGLAMILGAQEDIEVAWQAVDGADALRRCTADPVDIVLMDVQMPVMNGLEATSAFVAGGHPGRIIILTTFDTDGYVLGAIDAGAAGFLLKSTPPEQIMAAIRTVHSGDSVISPGPTRRLLSAMRDGRAPGAGSAVAPGTPGGAGTAAAPSSLPAGVTEREREILGLIALGLTNQEICDRLWLSMATVKTHVSHLLAKTGSRDRVQLVLLALRTGLVDLGNVLAG